MPRSSRSWCDTADSLRPSSVGEVADAQLGARERVEHPDARGVAEHLEGLGERDDRRLGEQGALEPERPRRRGRSVVTGLVKV